jgi:predicted ribosome quality control (RQC) complex YloA/Tae2 family protein
MKLSHLKQLIPYFKNFKKISAIYRVSDNILKIAFDKDDEIFFNMQRGSSSIFKAKEYARSKIYNAPFDVVLAKRFNRSTILDITLLNDDKIICFKTSLSSAYKEQITYLQVEFTGKFTNIIILDKDKIVLEALRHIDLFSSFREVKVGVKLKNIPPAPFEAKEYKINNIEEFLYETYNKEQNKKLSSLKKQKISFLEKKLKKLQNSLNNLDSKEELLKEAEKFEHYGNLVLSNMHNIKPYSKDIIVQDYDGTKLKIKLDKIYANVSNISTAMFNKSKKAKQRAKNLHIQEESLKSKIEHLKFFINTIQNAKDIAKIELLFPKKNIGKKEKIDDSIETFYIEGYKVQLGKNEKGNIKLLKEAKARDIWLHLRDKPSTHVIIRTDKQNLPQNVLKSAARLCVDFSTTQKDRFEVDYTQRREVSIQSGANVLYNKYKTLQVDNRD